MQTPARRDPLLTAGLVAAVAGGLWQIAILARVFIARLRYPADVDWLESSALYQAYRVQENLFTYGPIKEGYVPLFHPPGYPTLLGLLGKIARVDHALGRGLSVIFFIAAAALVARAILRRVAGAPGLALAAFAIGCAAAGMPVSGGFYDLVRDDTMAVLLAVLAAALVDGPPKLGPRRIALVAAVLSAIVYTRQPGVFFCVWIVVFVFLRDRRTGFLLALAAAAIASLVLVGLQFGTRGWYWMLTVSVLQGHPVTLDRFLAGLGQLTTFAPFLAALPIAVIALAIERRLSASAALWAGMLAASIPASLLPFAKVGGFYNDFIPTLFFAGPAAAFVAADVMAAIDRRAPRAVPAIFFAAGAFLFVRTWDPEPFVPTAEDRRRAAAFTAEIGALDGGVLCPRHPFLPIQARHRTLEWSDMPYFDILWSDLGGVELGAYIDRTRARWALVSGTEAPITQRELSTRFRFERPILGAPEMLAGEPSPLRYLLRRADPPADPRPIFDLSRGLAGWSRQGEAFSISPIKGAAGKTIHGAVDDRILTSYHPEKKDAATGTLTSPPFTLDRGTLSLRVGGSTSGAARVELRVGGRAVRVGRGLFERTETLIEIAWDVTAFRGQEAVLALIDEDTGPRGHLLVDHVIAY